MSGIRCLFEFSNDKYSWGEAHWWLTTQFSPTPISAVPAAQQLAAVRVPMLGNGASLNRIRLSTFPALGTVYDLLPPNIAQNPTWPADPTGLLYSSSRPFTAILDRAAGNPGGASNIFLAGIPSSIAHSVPGDVSGLQWGSCPGFSTRHAAFLSYITNGQWGWLSRASSSLFQGQGLVTNAAFPNMIGIQTAAVIPGLVVGSQALVKGFRRINTKLPKLGGIWVIGGILAPVAPAVNWTYFLLNSGAVPTNNYLGMGKIGLLYQNFIAYYYLNSVEITERKRGGSLGRPRGRSSTRV